MRLPFICSIILHSIREILVRGSFSGGPALSFVVRCTSDIAVRHPSRGLASRKKRSVTMPGFESGP